jgi:Protein of unknown function (DUF4019)
MKHGFVVLTCLSLLLFGGCAMHRSASQSSTEKRAREKEARAAALHWLQLVDAGDYAQAYEEEPARLRTATTNAQFNRSMEGRRAPFGKVLSRKFIGAAFTKKLTGSPDGHYESILFRTAFEHKSVAAERVILSYESSQWRVVDYRVY